LPAIILLTIFWLMTSTAFGANWPPAREASGELSADYTDDTHVLFLQHFVGSLTPTDRCGMVLDEGVLFRDNEIAFVQTKRKLRDECNLCCIVSRN
jgi:type I restriction-modification system DNA methylase subunit